MSVKGQRVELYALCTVANGGVPAFVFNSGEFTATITDNGVGDVTVTLGASNGVADTEVAYTLTIAATAVRITGSVIGDAAGPSLNATLDKRVRTFSEATGAVIDTGFTLAIYRRLYI